MAGYAKHVSKKGPTPQTEPIPGREAEMVQNSAGGFTFQVDDFTRLERFLILGSEGGTYYVGEKKLTKDNAECLVRCAKADFRRTLDLIVDVSVHNRAPKNDPAVFALAYLSDVAGSPANRSQVYQALPKVCRIGTHLFQFMDAVKQLRGFGPGLHRAVTRWYLEKEPLHLAMQMTKYASRKNSDGQPWTHRDVLRIVKPKNVPKTHEGLIAFAVGKKKPFRGESAKLAKAFLDAAAEVKEHGDNPKKAIKLIEEYKLPRELLPTELLNHVSVWEALLPHMLPNALVRNLGKMTEVGLIAPLSDGAKLVAQKLQDEDQLQKSRLHPFSVLLALATYKTGRGVKGSLSWSPVPKVLDALDDAFYKTFKFVVPSGKRHLLGLDISGSMWGSQIAGTHIDAATAAAAMSMVALRTEPECHTMAFCHRFVDAGLSAKTTLTDVLRQTRDLSRQMGGTDCALPMTWALQNKVPVDVFHVYTDNETWAGSIQPVQALQQYRQKMGIPAKLAVVGFTSTGFTIADPKDAGMMDFVGFDSAAPAVMADFARGGAASEFTEEDGAAE